MPSRLRLGRLRRGRPVSRCVAPVLVALVAATIAACAAGPSPLNDPRAILDRALVHLRAARSVHVEATVDGTLALAAVLGGPQASGPGLALTGTHLAGVLDLAGAGADLRFQVPALLGLEGELRQLGADTYLESSLTSRGWHRLGPSDLPAPLNRPNTWLGALVDWLERPATVPLRLDDASCGSGGCYVVRIAVSHDELQGLLSGGLGPTGATLGPTGTTRGTASADVSPVSPGSTSGLTGLPGWLAGATVSVDLRIDRSSFVLSDATFRVDFGTAGRLSVSVTFSGWDAGVAVASPPASEIVPGALFP